MDKFRRPESVLIVIFTDGGEFLLLERRRPPGFWQSVTGSLEWGELADAAARREVIEETGITQGVLVNLQWTQVYVILPAFGKLYALGIVLNLEHAFSSAIAATRAASRIECGGTCAVSLGFGPRGARCGILEHQSRRHCRTAPVATPMGTVVVYVHGLWLNGIEGVLLRKRLAQRLNAETRTFAYASVVSTVTDDSASVGGLPGGAAGRDAALGGP